MFDELKELNLDISLEEEFKKTAWKKMQDSLIVCPNRTITYYESFLAWLLILKMKPKVMLEIGGQHGQSGLIFTDALARIGSKFITIELGDDPRNKYVKGGTLKFLPDNDPNIVKKWGEATELLPGILAEENVDFVFHDCLHTWDHVLFCVQTVFDKDPKIIQTCHDCADGFWKPDVETIYGVIHAERPVFDKFFDNESYYYHVFAEKNGFGMAIHKELL